MCANAFCCDRCDDLYEGTPHQYVASGPTAYSADERYENGDPDEHHIDEWCEDCWTEFQKFRDGAEVAD